MSALVSMVLLYLTPIAHAAQTGGGEEPLPGLTVPQLTLPQYDAPKPSSEPEKKKDTSGDDATVKEAGQKAPEKPAEQAPQQQPAAAPQPQPQSAPAAQQQPEQLP